MCVAETKFPYKFPKNHQQTRHRSDISNGTYNDNAKL